MTYSIVQKSQLEGAMRMDAEYYQPEYLELVNKIKSANLGFQTIRGFGCKVVSGPFGSSLKSEAYLKKGVPFIRIVNLQDFFIENDELMYISNEDNNRLKQSQLFPSDLVLSKVGNIGAVSTIPEEFKVCNISENNIGIKISHKKELSKYKNFLLAFLNSKIGFLQVKRKISGNVQPKINVQDIYDLFFPMPSKRILEGIDIFINKSKTDLDISKLYYQQAENLLLGELGLKDFKAREDLCWVVNLSDTQTAGRMDADYFQPKYEQFLLKLKDYKSKTLGELASLIKGIEPGADAYQEKGHLYIRVSTLSRDGINKEGQKYLNEELYQKLYNQYEPKTGEILLTKDATPGIAYLIKEKIDGIISGGILRLNIKGKIDADYLTLCLNSMIGKIQAERDVGGSVISHWKPDQIKKILIPLIPQSSQQKIAELVRKSHAARKRSKELLEEAKRKVEAMIEKGVK